jgi:glycosyltransferase involved in cell wall biosynthesis
MHVAFVSMTTAAHRETARTLRTRRTARNLVERGHEATVLCAQWWDGDFEEFEREGVVYRRVTERERSSAFASKLPFVLRRVSPDVVQVVNAPAIHVTAAKTAGRFLRVPVVVDWWSADRTDAEAARRSAARGPDAVVVPSRTIETQVREYGANADDVRVIPESIDVDLVREADVDERADVVYARRLDEDANVENFLLALAELRDRTWRAAVVGDGPNRDEAEQVARDLRIDDRIEFLGDLPPEEFVPILKGAHVFAHTATRAPFATPLLWGLAAGCVGIVEYQAASSAHELVEGRSRGMLVTSPQELADAIVDAGDHDHRTFSESYGAYDHDAVTKTYLDAYREIVDDYGLF